MLVVQNGRSHFLSLPARRCFFFTFSEEAVFEFDKHSLLVEPLVDKALLRGL